MFRDASLSVSTASARMCRGDTNELPASPFVRLCSAKNSSDLAEVYATDAALASEVCSIESLPLIVFEARSEACRFLDEARIAAITCSPTGLSLIRCRSFSTVSGLLFHVRQRDVTCGIDLLDTSLFAASIGSLRILTSPLLRGTSHAVGSQLVSCNDVNRLLH